MTPPPNQPLEPTRLRRAVAMTRFDFMKQLPMFATLATASRG